MWLWLHKLASPRYFYSISGWLTPWLGGITLILLLTGLIWGLYYAPTDYQQGESYRIIFIHVPAAWMSMFIYVVMAAAAAIGLIWRIKLADVVASASAPIGAWFTFLALVTGSLWGKPMWGTWWVWDGRLTSELILLFLYLGFMALQAAIPDRRTAARAAAILALVGVVNIPIIHFSVEWWNTLHQPATITKLDKPSMDPRMLWPLLVMALAFKLYYATAVLMRARCEVLDRERNSTWVKELVTERT
jgi:heme exporter protein C